MLLAEANQRSELGDGVPVDESSQFTTPNSSILWKNPPKWHLPVRLIKTDACLVHICSSGPLERQDRYGTGFFSWRSKPAQAPEAPDHGISWDQVSTRDSVSWTLTALGCFCPMNPYLRHALQALQNGFRATKSES